MEVIMTVNMASLSALEQTTRNLHTAERQSFPPFPIRHRPPPPLTKIFIKYAPLPLWNWKSMYATAEGQRKLEHILEKNSPSNHIEKATLKNAWTFLAVPIQRVQNQN